MHGYNLFQKYRDYQKKLETENERLKLEIEQLRESSEVRLMYTVHWIFKLNSQKHYREE